MFIAVYTRGDPSGVVAFIFSASALVFRVMIPTPGDESNQFYLERHSVPI
jgi:hypothetical protein